MFNIRKKNFGKLDLKLFLILSAIVLFSATRTLNNKTILSQVIATVIGFLFMALVVCIDTDFIKKFYIPIYAICNILLFMVLIFGTGKEQWGSNSWIVIGSIRFQPAEFVKIGFILSFARYLEINKKNLSKPKTFLKVIAFGGFPILLILLQPDAGTAFVFIFIMAIMLFIAGLDLKYFLGALGLLIISSPILYSRLEPFQKKRILTFLNPEHDISDSSYQALQGRIAIGSGKFFGKGYMKGTQSQFNFIPEKQTDYIFPVLVEEFGFIGGFAVIILYLLLLYRLVILAENRKDSFSKLVIMGLSAMFLFHIFENIGMTLGVMPVTGIPLPFFSYGGTYQLINLIAVGIVFSVSIQKEALSFE